jgi:hypothetical protein
MKISKKIVIVAGYLIRYPLGGHVLSVLHFLIGLQKLGYEVVFVEHYGWPNSCYNPVLHSMSDDPSYGIKEILRIFENFGLKKWCYVDATGFSHGMSRAELKQLCQRSEILLSLWEATWLDEFFECKKRIFVDTDPGFTQFKMSQSQLNSCSGYASPYDFHHHFTYGTRIGKDDCPIPTHGITWLPTRPPIVLELLPPVFTPEAQYFTTVMGWNSRKAVVYEGVEYGQKDVEFMRVINLPQILGNIFEIAVGGANVPSKVIEEAGWRIANPREITRTPWAYRNYIAQSRGEFSVAVNLEVKTRSGWFSDRTAAYLASGKPAIVQDTGFSENLPTGQGLFAFQNLDDVINAVEILEKDYKRHCEKARRIAEEFFDSDKVLGTLLQECDLPTY